MSIVRIKKERNFVQINKEMLEEPELSLKAKGLISFCLTKPDDWQFHIEHLASVLKEGERSIRSALNEAITAGYAFRFQTRKENGDFGPWEIIVTDSKETLRKHRDSILSTGKIEIVFTERRFALAQVADAQNSRLLILEETKNDVKDNHHHQASSSLPVDPTKPKKNDDDDEFSKKKNEKHCDIEVVNTKGQKIGISYEEIYQKLSRFDRGIIKESIDKMLSMETPISNIIGYLESTCINIENQKSREGKQESKEQKTVEDLDQEILNRKKAEEYCCKCPLSDKRPCHFFHYIEFRHSNVKIDFKDKNFEKELQHQIKYYDSYSKNYNK